MNARAARLGGQLNITSASGQGTRVCLTWMLDEEMLDPILDDPVGVPAIFVKGESYG